MILDRTIAPASQPVREVNIIEAKTQYLDNGIPVHVIQAGKQSVIGMELIFRDAGLKHEEKKGACFFAIKMLAEGTSGKNAYQISEQVDKYGAFLQLSPGVDYSTMDVYCLSKYADELFAVMKELLTSPTFPEEELNKLKTIQLQRLKVSNEKSSVVASKKMKEVLFGAHHPYGISLDEADIESITREDILQYYHNHLFSQVEIVIAGAVEFSVLQAVENHFGDLNISKKGNVFQPQESILAEGKQHIVERPGNVQSSIRMGIPMFTKDHPDYTCFSVVNTLLGGYFGSRLMRNIREEKGLTYGISSALLMQQDAGYFLIGTDVKKEFTQLALDEIYKEIQVIQNTPIDEVELNTIKNYMAGRLLASVDTPFALAEKFKNIYLYGLGYDFYKNHLDIINNIQADDIQKMSLKYLNINHIKEVIVGGIG